MHASCRHGAFEMGMGGVCPFAFRLVTQRRSNAHDDNSTHSHVCRLLLSMSHNLVPESARYGGAKEHTSPFGLVLRL